MGIEFPANGLSEVGDGPMVSVSINVQISDALHSVEVSLTKNITAPASLSSKVVN